MSSPSVLSTISSAAAGIAVFGAYQAYQQSAPLLNNAQTNEQILTISAKLTSQGFFTLGKGAITTGLAASSTFLSLLGLVVSTDSPHTPAIHQIGMGCICLLSLAATGYGLYAVGEGFGELLQSLLVNNKLDFTQPVIPS